MYCYRLEDGKVKAVPEKGGNVMKQIRTRLLSLALAVCLVTAVTAPVSAEAALAAAVQPAGSVMETLMDVPILGSILRFFSGEKATSEDAATPEDAATAEDATPEQATPEQATDETAKPSTIITPDNWPAGWMVGAVSPQGKYPAGDPDAQRTLTLPAQLWTEQTVMGDASVRVANREETNFGDLVADAVAYAAASSEVWQNSADLQGLPLVAIVDGASFLKNVPAGTQLTGDNLSEYLEDSSLSLVIINQQKLNDILNYALQDMLKTGTDNSGSFPQISGLRFTYQTTDNDRQLVQAWLPGLDGETEIDLHDSTKKLALVLPSDLMTKYGLEGAEYTDYLGGNTPAVMAMNGTGTEQPAALTVHSALLDLPKNADTATLTALLARQGAAGRILPVTAENYTATLKTDGAVTNCTVVVYVDGVEMTGRIDGEGNLIVENLTPGSHTICLIKDGTPWLVSSISGLGVQNGTAIFIGALPEGTVTQPIATPAPAATPTPAPVMTPTPPASQAQTQTTQTTTAQGSNEENTPTPTPTPAVPAAPAATATPKPARTPAPVDDPTAGTIIGVTPAPTMTPTPTPSPTPEATPSPEEQQKAEEAEKVSSRLPLYVGIGVLAVCAVVVAIVLLRRHMEERPGSARKTYHGKNRK